MSDRIVILGAGITGLALAYILQQTGNHMITLVEKSDRVGGWIQSDRVNSFLFERGPRSIRSVGNHVPRLLKSLDLLDETIRPSKAAKNRYLWHDQSLHRLPRGPQSLLFNSTLSGLRRAIFGERRKAPTQETDESVYDFFERRFGERLCERFVDPMISGIYAGDPHELSMRACFPRLWEAEQKFGSLLKGLKHMKARPQYFSFKDGLQVLPERILSRLKCDVLLSTEATELIQHPNTMEVKTTGGDFRADRVYSTLPTPALAKLLPDYTPALSHSSVITVGLGYYNSVLKRQGFGYLIPSKENQNILGAVWDSSVFPGQDSNRRRTRITAMLGGAHRPDLIVS